MQLLQQGKEQREGHLGITSWKEIIRKTANLGKFKVKNIAEAV